MLTSIIYHCPPTKTATFSLCFLLLYLFYCSLSRFSSSLSYSSLSSSLSPFLSLPPIFESFSNGSFTHPSISMPLSSSFSFYLQTHNYERLCPSVQMLVSSNGSFTHPSISMPLSSSFSFYLQTHNYERLYPSVQMLVSWSIGPCVCVCLCVCVCVCVCVWGRSGYG